MLEVMSLAKSKADWTEYHPGERKTKKKKKKKKLEHKTVPWKQSGDFEGEKKKRKGKRKIRLNGPLNSSLTT